MGRKGQSGNPKGREAGTGRIEVYRSLLDPHVPELLDVLIGKAKEGNLTALRLIPIAPIRCVTRRWPRSWPRSRSCGRCSILIG
jgi:hypothetical protein